MRSVLNSFQMSLRDTEGAKAISGYHASMRLLRAGERRPRNDIKCRGRVVEGRPDSFWLGLFSFRETFYPLFQGVVATGEIIQETILCSPEKATSLFV
jgi:hypothetical protein